MSPEDLAAEGPPALPLLRPEWPVPDAVQALCTTRLGGVSRGPWQSLNLGAGCGDDPACVAENRRRLEQAAGLPQPPRWLRQVHGRRVLQLEASGGAVEPEADGSWTAAAEQVCVVLAADCLPVLLARRDGGAVAAVHAGWRGLAGGVLEAALSAVPGRAEDYVAWLGPRIGPEHFLVHEEVREAFTRPGDATCFRPQADGRLAADLGGLARRRLETAGVAVFDSGLCTASDAGRFFSHRRDGRCGRMAALIWRRHVAV